MNAETLHRAGVCRLPRSRFPVPRAFSHFFPMNALRQLLRNPGFTAATVLLLALVTASRAGTNDSVGPARRLAAVGQPLELPATAHVVPMRGVEPRGDRADLAPLRAIVGDARVVAVGEPAHGVHEPLAFRNHLLEYLVEELRFTAIAVESAFPESRPLAVKGRIKTGHLGAVQNQPV